MKTRDKVYKIIAAYLLLNLLAEYFMPVAAYALTGGPSQPEVESFEPIGTTEMVDMFTGDFNYNIPLMTVPGPNGGYPLNLAYHAGIGMEQEASWCGLGWNINAGVINRMLRGVPDDFKGATIEKQYQSKPNNTLAIGLQGPSDDELFGFSIGGVYGQLYYNNYKGVGYEVGLSLSGQETNSSGAGWEKSLSLSLSSADGLGVSPNVSYAHERGKHMTKFHLGLNYTSREGINSINFRSERYNMMRYRYETTYSRNDSYTHNGNEDYVSGSSFSKEGSTLGYKNHPSSGSGVSFSSGAFIPNVSHPQSGMNLRFALAYGTIEKNTVTTPFTFSEHHGAFGHVLIGSITTTSYGLKPGMNYNASLSLQWSPKDPIPYNAYGYLNTQASSTDAMLDFNREKDAPPTKDLPALPVPIYTYDSYVIKGQGIGGIFRPYRNDVSVLHDPNAGYTIPTLNLSGEMAANASGSSHWGIGAGVGFTDVYSGDWANMDDEIKDYYRTTAQSDGNALYEPVFFRCAGDQAENIPFTDYVGGTSPARFDMSFGFRGISLHPKLKNNLEDKNSNGYIASTLQMKNSRDKRNQNIEYYSNAQLNAISGFPNGSVQIFDPNNFPLLGTTSPTTYTYDRGSSTDFENSAYDDQIGAMSVLNPDGNRYYYALPAYNKTQKEVVCAVDKAVAVDVHNPTAYYGTTNSVDNNEGEDHLYSSITTPAYAHSYLLTAIVGADYVDITGNGPSDDDLGYWVKFNYSRIDDYNWRVPYATQKGNLIGGYISNVNDDKVSYVYGEKEIYYLNSVETKTHLACFFLNEGTDVREDGRGVSDENNLTPSSGQYQKKLTRIELYSKQDIAANGSSARSIKTVNFGYDYPLCKNVENNFASSGDKGKLTLTSLWFSYLGNEKGQLSPYTFDYHQDPAYPGENPDYSLTDMDRWGNYQVENGTDKVFNSENPYVDQTVSSSATTSRDKAAGAWSLKEITLPSGGKIQVQYEADDYAYVQDKQAMQMMLVKGTLDGSGNLGTEIDKDHLRIEFQLEEPIADDANADANLYQYANGIDKLYFKIFEKLKKYYGGASEDTYKDACDYVEGYADIKYESGHPAMGFPEASVGGYFDKGYIEVEPVKVTNNPLEVRETHPFRKAGWQYLRMQRPDLFGPPNDFGGAAFTLNPVTQAVQQMLNMVQALSGYYNYCWIRGFCKNMTDESNASTVNYRPSYIRLNCRDYIKYGGGHRVKQIKLQDNWGNLVDDATPGGDGNEDNNVYGQEFSYRMPDGTSSGVAEYEPLVGGEEIPHHLPVPYSSDKFLSNDKALFIEEPFGESMFPPANVGYRRVVVRNLEQPGVTKNREGIKVYEFYTAKEFPVRVDKTEDVLQKKYWLPLPIPFLGSMSFNNRGYSQGYSIELNDMHGKPRSVATYSSNANINDPFAQPVTKIDYIYNTLDPFNDHTANYLSNTVTVLDGDANYRQGELGLITEMYMDKAERYSFNTTFNLDPNFDVAGGSPLPSFSLVPSLEINEAQFRSAVTVKVIQRTGILMETRAFDQGSMAVTKNLMFDAQTGMPMLTEVNNDFDKPVYNYKYGAHWAYDGMGSAAQNWGAVFNLTVTGGSGEVDYPDAAKFFNAGDELFDFTNGVRYWVKDVTSAIAPSPDKITLVKENNSAPLAGTYGVMVIRSGRRNQQAVTNGTIVSLSNPVTEREFPLFAALNTWLADPTNYDSEEDPMEVTYQNCADENSTTTGISIDATNNRLVFSISEGGEVSCRSYVQFDDDFLLTAFSQLEGYSLTKMGNDVKVYNGTTGDTHWGEWVSSIGNCYEECIPNVLHADAQRFTDRWNYFYADLGDPISAISSDNDYRTGQRGIWRQETSHLYQVDRKQNSGYTIDVDGTYKHFVPYNWAITGAANNRWSLASRTTLYSPFGYALEERDTINVYSSALYGYDNSLATAVSANSQYFESGFDGFEDYYTGYPDGTAFGHGHFLFKTGASTYPSLGDIGHTGKKSIEVGYGSPVTFTTNAVADYSTLSSSTDKFTPIADKEYAFSCWVKNPNDLYSGQATVELKINSSVVATYTLSKSDVIIEGWHQVNMTIPTLSAADQLDVVVTSTDSGHPVYLDDVRVVPFKGAIKTYVYDPITLWLVAELDNRNFATFYNYDEEGALVQIKKETTNGIITVRSARNNIHQ